MDDSALNKALIEWARPWPLCGYLEIAARAAVKRPVVTNWRKRYPEFPQPVAVLATGPVWWWPEVAQWLDQTGRVYDADRQVADLERRRGVPPTW